MARLFAEKVGQDGVDHRWDVCVRVNGLARGRLWIRCRACANVMRFS
jgi:hypothetical protein